MGQHFPTRQLLGTALAIAGVGLAPPVFANHPDRVSLEARGHAVVQATNRAALPTNSAVHAGGGSAADTALAYEVASALANDPKLEGTTITVAANNGDVMLSGSANSSEQGALAENTARRVAGVHSVSGTLSPTAG